MRAALARALVALWRPFEGPLSPAAQRQAVTILKNLYCFLVDHNYLMGIPWSAVTIPRGGAPKLNAGRSLSRAQWAFAQQQVALMGDTSAQLRLRFALEHLYATGLRLSEVVAARVNDLAWIDYGAEAGEGEKASRCRGGSCALSAKDNSSARSQCRSRWYRRFLPT